MTSPMCMIVHLLVLLGSTLCASSQAGFADSPHHTNSDVCSQMVGRREWRMMERENQASWIAGVKCLASVYHQRLSITLQGETIGGTHSLYDDFAIAHAEMDGGVHKNSYFLLWHRWFLYLFDKRLRDTCGYAGPTPFWDWSLDVDDLLASPVFDSDPTHGLGSSGDCASSPESDCIVLDGSFAPTLDPREFTPILSFPTRHTLRRNLSLYPDDVPNGRPHNLTLTPTAIANHTRQTTPGNFLEFQHSIEQMHDHVHNFVGGDLAGTCPKALSEIQGGNCRHAFTPNDPLFWLHHAQLDRLWSNWQNRHPDNYYAFGAPRHSNNVSTSRHDLNASIVMLQFDRLSTEVAVDVVFDHSASPLCYFYEDM